ncbi:ubiquitin carboxyl-terminal hydrolase 18 [Ziziphus jujuba]|uniref:Ubiquitin carboxyl-terminal hydrolase 18 n=1 Tax=Ziziphus jujuba TaxID=326968 RepID=A0ABM3IP19_ZIZJJ|nr:ubiquitin carboxyl-terminal hydrolase 18 [Ziziphus jujuba]
MHVAGVSLDLNWFLQFIFTVFIIAVGLLHLLKNTASKYFEVDANFEGGGDTTDRTSMPGLLMEDPVCIVCGNSGPKQCSRCKAVRYCSLKCQNAHWKSGHKSECKEPDREKAAQNAFNNRGVVKSGIRGKTFSGIALVPARGSETAKLIKQPKEILFPYDEFVKLFNWDKPGFPPCGLLNCGNSCFANVVLQCLTFTRPLVAYLLEKGHRLECIRNDWCFLCEFQTHLERASRSLQAFSPTNIISRLRNIGGNLGYGRQEDAHEFMRFAIDTMQSICLDEFGGEKAVPPASQETTIIQHIFGGYLQSQVICTACNKISNQYENMMDLTVEIHGEAASLEECLDQFTVEELLHGENMYKCDGCNDYVKASKRLMVKQAPNILTIALKRFQSGRFGKLNKSVTFPETLDLSPYMSEAGNGLDIYKLYAVVVHVDMLNASFFGHYICYTKDFRGNWYRIDDCKVTGVELEEVLSQGAYMLLYSRVRARPSCLRPPELIKKEEQIVNVEEPCLKEQVECSAQGDSGILICPSGSPSSASLYPEVSAKESSLGINSEAVREHFKYADADVVIPEPTSVVKEVSSCEREVVVFGRESEASKQDQEDRNTYSFESGPSVSNVSEKVSSVAVDLGTIGADTRDVASNKTCQSVVEEVSLSCEKNLSVSNCEDVREDSGDTIMVDCFSEKDLSISNCEDVKEDSDDTDMADCSYEKDLPVSNCEDVKKDSEHRDVVDDLSTIYASKEIEIHSNGHAPSAADESDSQGGHAHKLDSGTFCFSSEASRAENHKMKHLLLHNTSYFHDGTGVKRVRNNG